LLQIDSNLIPVVKLMGHSENNNQFCKIEIMIIHINLVVAVSSVALFLNAFSF
jgi:hypothetical protein